MTETTDAGLSPNEITVTQSEQNGTQSEQNGTQSEQNGTQSDAPLAPRVNAVASIIAEARVRRLRESGAKAEQS